MRKIIITIVKSLLAILMCFVLFADDAFAQDTLLVVPDPVSGGALNRAIAADTLAGVPPNRVYKLVRGGWYFLNGAIENVDWHLRIVGEEGDGPPAVLQPMVDLSGVSRELINCWGDLTLKNIYFLGVDNLDAVKGILLNFKKDSIRTVIDNCVFDYNSYICIRNNSISASVHIFKNCIFRNMAHLSNWDNGKPFTTRKGIVDSLTFQNCTFINITGNLWSGWQKVLPYVKFDHNTVVNSMREPFGTGKYAEAHITNNIFYNTAMRGWGRWFAGTVRPDPFDPVYPDSAILQPYGMMHLDSTSMDLYPEDERIIEFSNNAMFYSQEVVDFHAADTLKPDPFFNQWTKWIMSCHPGNMTVSDTVYMDPGFISLPGTIDSLIGYCRCMRMDPKPPVFPGIFYDPDGPQFVDTWPLPEDFSYPTISPLYIMGTRGFPLGDLNWFPNKYNDWITGVEDFSTSSKPTSFSLSQNYPNPFNPTTNISFNLPATQKISVVVFDILGRKVSTLVNNERFNAGTNMVTWDGTNEKGNLVSSGVYFYQVSSNDFKATKKMVLMK
jgi:hypothetical protein